MNNLTIFDTDIKKESAPDKPTYLDLTVEQRLDLMLEGIETKEATHDALVELEEACRAHHNAEVLREAHRRFSGDKGLEAICSSEEAWNMSDTLKKTLTKFNDFFNKIFEYVNNFVVLRVTSVSNTIHKWEDILSNTKANKEKLDKLKKNYDVKDTTIPTIRLVKKKTTVTINKLTTIGKKVKTIAPGSGSAAAVKELKQPSEDPSYKEFDEKWRSYEAEVPEGDNSGTTKAQDAVTGNWFEVGSVKDLAKDVDHLLVVIKNMKRLKMTCENIVRSLEKTSDVDDGSDKNINDAKIKWLRDFSKNILSSMINRLTTITSRAASKCSTLVNKYNSNE
jgi:hypothetical protein